MFSTRRRVAFLMIGIGLMVLLYHYLRPPELRPENLVAYSDFLDQIDRGAVSDVAVGSEIITYRLSDGRKAATRTMKDPGLTDRLVAHHVRSFHAAANDDAPLSLYTILVDWAAPLLAFAALFGYLNHRLKAAVKKPD